MKWQPVCLIHMIKKIKSIKQISQRTVGTLNRTSSFKFSWQNVHREHVMNNASRTNFFIFYFPQLTEVTEL